MSYYRDNFFLMHSLVDNYWFSEKLAASELY